MPMDELYPDGVLDRLERDKDALHEQVDALKSRCSRLRAALVGVVHGEECEPLIGEYMVLIAMCAKRRSREVLPTTMTAGQLLSALEVLRETAEVKT